MDLKPMNKNKDHVEKNVLTIGMASRLIPLKNIQGAISSWKTSPIIPRPSPIKLTVIKTISIVAPITTTSIMNYGSIQT